LLNSTVLEVSIGLLVCFGSVALVASSIYEAIASILKLRAATLLAGVKALLNDQSFSDLAMKVYNHAMVNPRDDGAAKPNSPPAMKPSYIEPRAFAIALIDSVGGVSATFDQLKTKIGEVSNPQIRELLTGMYTRADNSLEKLHAQVAAWFDAGMGRVSGGYKRQAQLVTFLIALAVAALLNIDSFHLFSTLWRHPEIAAKLPTGADAANNAWQNLDSLPIGWPQGLFASITTIGVFGWLITATSALFGAPFWFDRLQRLVNIRGAGTKPAEKPADKPTAA
jgi:hypothetical protein